MRAECAQDDAQVIRNAQNGDQEAMRRLISMHKPLIQSLSWRIHCAYLEKEVLVQAGILGFMQAVYHYQACHQVKLTTYSVPWILGEMKKAMRLEAAQSAMLSLERECDADGNTLGSMIRGCADIDFSAMDLRMALEKLEKEAQLLICMRYFRGSTQKEAALLLKKSQAQISRMERNALDRLHMLLS